MGVAGISSVPLECAKGSLKVCPPSGFLGFALLPLGGRLTLGLRVSGERKYSPENRPFAAGLGGYEYGEGSLAFTKGVNSVSLFCCIFVSSFGGLPFRPRTASAGDPLRPVVLLTGFLGSS